MQYNTVMFWLSISISANWFCPSLAFIALSQSASGPARAATGLSPLRDVTDIYTLANAQLMMDQVPSGRVSYKPHDLEDVNIRPVYDDPGDELLRALNADIAATGQELGTQPMEPEYADAVYNEMELASKHNMQRKLERDLQEEQDIITKSAILLKMIEDPTIDTLPIVYVEEDQPLDESNNIDYNPDYSDNAKSRPKRGRYYRRFPWKRRNNHRGNYDPQLPCTPSKEDVLKLLTNINEVLKGKPGRSVTFCNRKVPARRVLTNIRFLG